MSTTSWLIFFIVLIIFELLTMGLTTIWFALGAVAGFIAAIFDANIYVQWVLFILVSFVTLIFTRPVLFRRLNKKIVKTNADTLVGQLAVVTTEVDNLEAKGAATINGLEWTARSSDTDVKLLKGSVGRIIAIKGNKLILEPTNETID
ncbi:MAG: NfeD family protein [Lachnospiraceae bacterium]|nr:NfeD family protein [Lachnospiraceae bacterium]